MASATQTVNNQSTGSTVPSTNSSVAPSFGGVPLPDDDDEIIDNHPPPPGFRGVPYSGYDKRFDQQQAEWAAYWKANPAPPKKSSTMTLHPSAGSTHTSPLYTTGPASTGSRAHRASLAGSARHQAGVSGSLAAGASSSSSEPDLPTDNKMVTAAPNSTQQPALSGNGTSSAPKPESFAAGAERSIMQSNALLRLEARKIHNADKALHEQLGMSPPPSPEILRRDVPRPAASSETTVAQSTGTTAAGVSGNSANQTAPTPPTPTPIPFPTSTPPTDSWIWDPMDLTPDYDPLLDRYVANIPGHFSPVSVRSLRAFARSATAHKRDIPMHGTPQLYRPRPARDGRLVSVDDNGLVFGLVSIDRWNQMGEWDAWWWCGGQWLKPIGEKPKVEASARARGLAKEVKRAWANGKEARREAKVAVREARASVEREMDWE